MTLQNTKHMHRNNEERGWCSHSQNTRWCPSVSGTTSAFHPSSPASSSARYLKASEGRFSLCSCSALPSAWHKLPSSQPRPTAHPSTASVNERFRWGRERSFSLSLPLSTPCLPPSFPHCLSLFLSRSAQWQPMCLHLAMPPAAANTVTDRDHPDLYEREKETERCSPATWHYHICFVLCVFEVNFNAYVNLIELCYVLALVEFNSILALVHLGFQMAHSRNMLYFDVRNWGIEKLLEVFFFLNDFFF